MASRPVTLGVLVLLAVCYYVQADVSMDELCQKHKDAGRCNLGGIKKQCAKVCSDDGGGGEEPTQPPAPSSKNEQEPEEKTTTTKKSNGNKHCDKRSPCVGLEEANAAFHSRCEASNGAISPGCYPHCRYDEDTATIKTAFLKGPCNLKQLRPYLTAASNGKDNSACCADKGVLAQKKTGVCGCFCNPTGPVWPQKGETMKYAPCVSVLQGIMQCHYFAEGAD